MAETIDTLEAALLERAQRTGLLPAPTVASVPTTVPTTATVTPVDTVDEQPVVPDGLEAELLRRGKLNTDTPVEEVAITETEDPYADEDPILTTSYYSGVSTINQTADREDDRYIPNKRTNLVPAAGSLGGMATSYGSDPASQLQAIKDQQAIERQLALPDPDTMWDKGMEVLDEARIEVAALLKDENKLRAWATRSLLEMGTPLVVVPDIMMALEIAPLTGTTLALTELNPRWQRIKDSFEKDNLVNAMGTVSWESSMAAIDIASGIMGTKIAIKGMGNLLSATSRFDKVNMAGSAMLAERLLKENAQALATKVASENTELSKRLLKEFEDRNGIKISIDGKYDPELARAVGKEKAVQVMDAQNGTVRAMLNDSGGIDIHPLAHLANNGDELMEPILKPEKFDSIVALAADLAARNPAAFKDKKTPIIDILFNATINKDIVSTEELLTMLNKYDLSFEDYMLTVVSGGSEAGRVLSKLSQIRRANPAGDPFKDAAERKLRDEAEGFRETWLRIEGIRRGLLVSQIATASRNFTSAVIRAPLEGLANVMDTAMWNAANEGSGKALKTFIPFTKDSAWGDSFRHMRYMFARGDMSKDYTNYILDRPEYAEQFKRMFNTVGEIRKMKGSDDVANLKAKLTAGTITPAERITLDKSDSVGNWVMSAAEDAVDVLNGPNRWQEHLIRRGAFLGEIERLVKREWGIDFMEVINKGEIKELMNDTAKYRPLKARSFNDIVDDATRKALDVTYAKAPEVPVFQEITSFITNTGLTVVAPFPRFMFASMELMGQYAAGASIPLSRKVMQLTTLGKKGSGPLTAKDRERISRNLIGMGGIAAAYMYRTSEDVPANYKEMKVDDGSVVDVSPQYPMRQFLYLGEVAKRVVDGTFNDWFDTKEFSETFIGVNITKGIGSDLIQEVADLASGTSDLSSREAAARALGAAVGNYASTWLVPFAQIVDAQRVWGERGTDIKQTGTLPVLDVKASFLNAATKPLARVGLMSPDEENALPVRQFVMTDKKEKISPLTKLLFGVSVTNAQNKEGEYLTNLGFTEWDITSRSGEPSVRDFENKLLRDAMPAYVSQAIAYEKKLRAEYYNPRKTNDATRDQYSEDLFVVTKIKPLILTQIRALKTSVRELGVSKTSPFVQMLMKYKSMPSEDREAAAVLFWQREGKAPDMSLIDKKKTVADLHKLITLGNTYKDAIKKTTGGGK